MLFASYTFLFIFLPFLLLMYFLSKTRYRNYILTVFSLFFYAYGGPKYLILMLFSIAVNYIMGLLVDKYRNQKTYAKIIVIFTTIINLAFLGYFKYADFFIVNANNIFHTNIALTNVVLPIGISFYTFQGLSYVIDIYRGHGDVQRNPINVALYISLFPQLIAGPIVRYETVAQQINERETNLDKFSIGLQRFIFGLAKKLIIANTFGEIADNIFCLEIQNIGFTLSWIGAIAYMIQIYYDFGGYSDMAIGLGKMFGFDFLENFNYPYFANSVTDFWRRWHISLSTWFRDYVYIPLGGNRKGKGRHIFNILVVWTLTGFWHGASWHFMLWGMYYGAVLLFEKFVLNHILEKCPNILRHIYTLLIVIVGWVIFRSDYTTYALHYLKTMFSFQFDSNDLMLLMQYFINYRWEFIIACIGAVPTTKYLYNWLKNTKKVEENYLYLGKSIVCVCLLIVSICYLVGGSYNPFIYFRF